MICGRVWKYGDDVNTDLIYPGRYTYMMLNEEQMGAHALEDLDSEFNQNARPGDIVVAGRNWGCGSAREQAVKTLVSRKISAVVAESFALIYFRNSLNEGLPVIVCREAVRAIRNGETIKVDMAYHLVITEAGPFAFGEYHPYVQQMVNCGGLLPYVRKQLREQGTI